MKSVLGYDTPGPVMAERLAASLVVNRKVLGLEP